MYRTALRWLPSPMMRLLAKPTRGFHPEPNDQVSHRSAELSGDFGQEPDLAVPALVASLQGTNVLVAGSAARSLGRFGKTGPHGYPCTVGGHQDRSWGSSP